VNKVYDIEDKKRGVDSENVAEIIEIINELNNLFYIRTGNEWLSPYEFVSNGDSTKIMFLQQELWYSEDDMREFDEEKNEYEPLETYIIRESISVIEKLNEFLSPLKEEEEGYENKT